MVIVEHRQNLTWLDHGTIIGSRKMGHCLLSGNYLRYFSQATRVRVYQEHMNYGQISAICESRGHPQMIQEQDYWQLIRMVMNLIMKIESYKIKVK